MPPSLLKKRSSKFSSSLLEIPVALGIGVTSPLTTLPGNTGILGIDSDEDNVFDVEREESNVIVIVELTGVSKEADVVFDCAIERAGVSFDPSEGLGI